MAKKRMIGTWVLGTNNNTVVPGEKVYSELPGSGNNIQQETQKDFLDFDNKNQNNNLPTVSNNKYVENIPFEKSGIEAKTFTTIPTTTQQSSSLGGVLPQGGAVWTGNVLWKGIGKKRMLTLPDEEDDILAVWTGNVQQSIIPPAKQQSAIIPTKTTQMGVDRAAVDQANQQTIKDNYLKQNPTATTYPDWTPVTGANPNGPPEATGDFATDWNAMGQYEVWQAIQGGEKMNQQNAGIQEGGLAYVDLITKQHNDQMGKLESDKLYKQQEFERAAAELQADYDITTEQVAREAELAIQQAAFMGAWTGAGQSSGYVQGITNMAQDVKRTLANLTAAYGRATAGNEAAAKKTMEDFTLALKSTKQQFDYENRDILANANLNYNEIMAGAASAGLDTGKIEKSLYNLASSVVEGRNKAMGTYIDNQKKIVDTINAQIDGTAKLQDIDDKKRAQLTTILNADKGEAIGGLSNKQIDDYVSQGYMSPAEGAGYKNRAMSMAMNTLQELGQTTTWDGKIIQQGVVGAEDGKKIQEYVNQGFTYMEAVAQVAASDPSRFNKMPIQAPLDPLQQAQLNNYNAAYEQTQLENQQLYNDLVGWGGGWGGQIRLGETPIDTGIKNVYWSTVKLAPTVAGMVTNAMTVLAGQGIDIKIADSFRSNATQAQAYASGKAWVAPPGESFHELWQAFDLSQSGKDKMNDPRVFKALKEAGLQQLPGEWRHWSYGEMGSDKATDKYSPQIIEQANSILNGVGKLPSLTDKNYSKVQGAVNDLLNEKINSTDDYQLQALYKSSNEPKEVGEAAIKNIADSKTVISGLNNLTKDLKDQDGKKIKVGPIEWFLRNKNPWDVDAQAIAVQVNSLAPKVARGVFGEVGVLTDADVARYMKTIPNLKQTKDLATVTSDLLKIGVYKMFINSVITQAQANRNMSNFIPDYEKAKKFLESKGVSVYPFDADPGSTSPAAAGTPNRGRKTK